MVVNAVIGSQNVFVQIREPYYLTLFLENAKCFDPQSSKGEVTSLAIYENGKNQPQSLVMPDNRVFLFDA